MRSMFSAVLAVAVGALLVAGAATVLRLGQGGVLPVAGNVAVVDAPTTWPVPVLPPGAAVERDDDPVPVTEPAPDRTRTPERTRVRSRPTPTAAPSTTTPVATTTEDTGTVPTADPGRAEDDGGGAEDGTAGGEDTRSEPNDTPPDDERADKPADGTVDDVSCELLDC